MLLQVLCRIGSNIIQNNVHGSLAKNLGFGFAATAIEDQILEGDWQLYNVLALTFGTAAWIGGLYLEKKHAQNHPTPAVRKSTTAIKQLLSHHSGFGVVSAITHYIKDVDTHSGSFAVLNMGMIGPAAIAELNKAMLIHPTIPWEKSRLLILIASDFFLAFGVKKIMNEDNHDPLIITSAVLGFCFAMAEAGYGLKKDSGINLQSYVNRRVFKILGGVNLIFTLLDIINSDFNKYTTADNVYLTLGSVLLFVTLLELRAVAMEMKERDALVWTDHSSLFFSLSHEVQSLADEKEENNSEVSLSALDLVQDEESKTPLLRLASSF